MKKKQLYWLGMAILLLAGCHAQTSKENDTKESNVSTESKKAAVQKGRSTSYSQSIKKDSSNAATQPNSRSSETSASQTASNQSQSQQPEIQTGSGINETTIGNNPIFYFQGMNVPISVSLDDFTTAEKKVTFITKVSSNGEQDITQYAANFQQISPKNIRVFSADRSGIRTVNVDVEIDLTAVIMNKQASNLSGPLYLFINRSGTLSLATPNYAGNVPDDQRDVMIELVK